MPTTLFLAPGFSDLPTVLIKGTFLLEDIYVFVISPNKRTFSFPEHENLNFGDF